MGRTARAGRSGVAISLVNQYELEWYMQIEKLIGNQWMTFFSSFFLQQTISDSINMAGKKLPQFSAQEEEVLMLLERVAEAKRISIMVLNYDYNFSFRLNSIVSNVRTKMY